MVLRVVNKIEESIICLLLVSMTLLVFLDVVMRFGFNAGFMWSQELTLLMSAWMVLFGASYGLPVGSHIGMDAFVKIFSRPVRRILSCVAALLALIYCALILYGSWIYLKKMHLIGIELEDLPIPAWIAHSILLFGYILLTVRLVIIVKDLLTDQTDGFKHADEAKDSMELAEAISKGEGAK